jgi:alkylation response protein AidB-like acyl-CoA dehydrogenase
MLVPAEFGGSGLDICATVDVLTAVSRADASAGWSLMAIASATAIASAYVGPAAFKDMFGSGRLPMVGGMLAPTGKAYPVEGGYEVEGRYSFGSGCRNVDWFASGTVIIDQANPGKFRTAGTFLPRERVIVESNWDVMGLRGTGSIDYQVPRQFVAMDYTIDVMAPVPQRGGPMFQLGIVAFGGSGHTAVVLGIAERAMEEVLKVASVKTRPGYVGVIADNALFREQFAFHDAGLMACKALIQSTYAEAQRAVAAGEKLSSAQRHSYRQTAIWAHRTAYDIVQFCFNWGGAQSIRNPSALGRCMRDMSVGMQHVLIDPVGLVDAGPAVMKAWLSGTERGTERGAAQGAAS